MRISPSLYPLEPDWKKWVIFDAGHKEVLLFFLMRLAYFAKTVLKRPVHLISGFRTFQEQEMLYTRYLSYKSAYNAWVNGGKVGPAPAEVPLANPPGKSAHEYHYAVDVHGPKENYPELVLIHNSKPGSQSIEKFGLFIPNWSGSYANEWWHIQPIESMGYTGTLASFVQTDDIIYSEDDMLKLGDRSDNVKAWQRTLTRLGFSLVDDGSFGNLTLTATKAYQKSVGLTETGVVDDATYSKSLDSLLALCSDNAALKSSVASLTAQLTDAKGKESVAESTASALQSRIDAYKKAVSEL